MKNIRLVNKVDKTACQKFLDRYPEMEKAMKEAKGRSLMSQYVSFLNTKSKTEHLLGGSPREVSSPTFGKKIFYDYDFFGTSGFAEIFQYLKSK